MMRWRTLGINIDFIRTATLGRDLARAWPAPSLAESACATFSDSLQHYISPRRYHFQSSILYCTLFPPGAHQHNTVSVTSSSWQREMNHLFFLRQHNHSVARHGKIPIYLSTTPTSYTVPQPLRPLSLTKAARDNAICLISMPNLRLLHPTPKTLSHFRRV